VNSSFSAILKGGRGTTGSLSGLNVLERLGHLKDDAANKGLNHIRQGKLNVQHRLGHLVFKGEAV
jgi:hypothetical protein